MNAEREMRTASLAEHLRTFHGVGTGATTNTVRRWWSRVRPVTTFSYSSAASASRPFRRAITSRRSSGITYAEHSEAADLRSPPLPSSSRRLPGYRCSSCPPANLLPCSLTGHGSLVEARYRPRRPAHSSVRRRCSTTRRVPRRSAPSRRPLPPPAEEAAAA